MVQEIVFVTGKGGVGKSTFAAALALKLSMTGKKVLLIELGDQSFYKEMLNLATVTFSPQKVRENLWISLWSGTDCLRNYAKYLIRVESLVRLFFENQTMRSLVNIAPGLRELSILGQITSGHRHHGPVLPFDCFVIDGFATGHFLSLLRAPKGLAEAIRFGPMHEQSQGIHKVICDENICKYFILSLPEELAFREGNELANSLHEEFQISPRLVLNKMVSLNLEPDFELKLDQMPVASFTEFINNTTRKEKKFFTEIQQAWPNSFGLPMYFTSESWSLIEKMSINIPLQSIGSL